MDEIIFYSRDEVKKQNVEKVNALTEEKENLENLLAYKTNEINKLHGEQYKVSSCQYRLLFLHISLRYLSFSVARKVTTTGRSSEQS